MQFLSGGYFAFSGYPIKKKVGVVPFDAAHFAWSETTKIRKSPNIDLRKNSAMATTCIKSHKQWTGRQTCYALQALMHAVHPSMKAGSASLSNKFSQSSPSNCVNRPTSRGMSFNGHYHLPAKTMPNVWYKQGMKLCNEGWNGLQTLYVDDEILLFGDKMQCLSKWTINLLSRKNSLKLLEVLLLETNWFVSSYCTLSLNSFLSFFF